jgi:hypothetical protein
MSAGLCAVLAATPGLAKKPTPTANPEQVRRLLACRSVADVGQRLACFDREIVTLDQALAKKDVVMIDRQSSAAARRSLFGFSVPSFGGLFGGDEDEVKQIDSTVTSAHRNGEGGWTVRLADGSVWTQTDDNLIALEPRRGDKIIVHRRALGSYTLSVNKQPGVKVRRVG